MTIRFGLVVILLLVLGACGADASDVGDGATEPTAPPTDVTVAPDLGDDGSVSIPDDDPNAAVVSPGPDETTVPTLPRPTVPVDQRGSVFISSSEMSIAESWPIQVFVAVAGDKPTPCHEVDWAVTAVDGIVDIELFSVDSGQICAQVLEPFQINIAAGSFDSGDWIVVLNGDQIGEFTP